MFICAHCLRHTAPAELKFSLTHVSHLEHPGRVFFEKRFCSGACLVKFLGRMGWSGARYALGQHYPDEDPVYSPPATPPELLTLVQQRRLTV